MPKDEFDFDDPLELNGVAFPTLEDTTDAMCECFIEEYMRMGYNHKAVLALFRNPNYIGIHMAFEKRGEEFIRNLISEIFARWGRPIKWSTGVLSSSPPVAPPPPPPPMEVDDTLCDPFGAPVPAIRV